LPHRLRSAAARVGLSDLAALMDQAARAGPAGVLDAMLEALAGSGALFVVDEVQNAEPEALALLTRLTGQLGADQRLLLIGREAPLGIGSLRRDSGAVWLGDPYEPWAELPRQRLRNQALGLLDLCADRAVRAGDLGEAVRCLERAIELAPDDEERYLSAARHMVTQGRRGAARRMVQRARSVVDSLGVQPSVLLIQLEDQLLRRAYAGHAGRQAHRHWDRQGDHDSGDERADLPLQLHRPAAVQVRSWQEHR
jgi:tetratricopeptide (TPR) repeat protein